MNTEIFVWLELLESIFCWKRVLHRAALKNTGSSTDSDLITCMVKRRLVVLLIALCYPRSSKQFSEGSRAEGTVSNTTLAISTKCEDSLSCLTLLVGAVITKATKVKCTRRVLERRSFRYAENSVLWYLINIDTGIARSFVSKKLS